jgi:hypothetical protein
MDLFSNSSQTLWNKMPKRNKYILGVSSLWMIIPIINTQISNLSGLLGAVCTASTLFWYDPRQASLLHKADKYLSLSFAFTLSGYTIIDIIFYNSSIILFTTLSGSTLIFFNLSDYLFKQEKYNYQLIAHLSFRYSIFLWSYIIMNKLSYYDILITTIGYLINILGMLIIKSWDYYSYFENCSVIFNLVLITNLIKNI